MFRHSPGKLHVPLLHLLDPCAVSARLWGLVCYGWSDPKTSVLRYWPYWLHQGGLNLGPWESPH